MLTGRRVKSLQLSIVKTHSLSQPRKLVLNRDKRIEKIKDMARHFSKEEKYL